MPLDKSTANALPCTYLHETGADAGELLAKHPCFCSVAFSVHVCKLQPPVLFPVADPWVYNLNAPCALESLYQAPFAQHQHGLSTPHYLSRQLVQDPPLQSHHKPSRSATGASSGEIGTAFGQAPGKAPHAASSAPSGGREEGSSLLGIRLSQASSDVTEPGMPPPDVPMFPCAMKRRPSFVMQVRCEDLLCLFKQAQMPTMEWAGVHTWSGLPGAKHISC
eukprot:1148502-Pelagomonas_calceolata.AAC.5